MSTDASLVAGASTRSRPQSHVWLNWRVACLLGLISSSYSTIISSLGAQRVGRDALVDWMVVATIPVRDAAIDAQPQAWAVFIGILFHQWADFSWAVVFFGLLGRWTANLGPGSIAAIAVPWAFATSASEWLFLVPWIPFQQPIFTLEQPYWLGLFVHVSSALMYPLFPGLRERIARVRPSRHRTFTAGWASGAGVVAVGLAIVALMGSVDREPGWRGDDPTHDQAFMRRMAAHHLQGVVLADLGARRAHDPHLRAVAELMAAAQEGEIRVMQAWWRSWFPGTLPPASAAECLSLPGMLTAADIETLRVAPDDAFDRRFVALMTRHHLGSIAMADDALDQQGDLRIKALAHAIRHSQTGEIALMHGAGPGPASVAVGSRALVSPPGKGFAVAQEIAR